MVRRRLGRRRRPDRRRARHRPGTTSSCSRPAAATTRPTSPAGAARLPADVLARRADADRRLQRQPPGRLDARRRPDGQLVQLPAHAAVGARAVGVRVRPGGRRRAGVRPSSRRGLAAASASTTAARTSTARTSACATGAAALGLVVQARQPQRRPGALLARLGRPHRLRRPHGRQARRASDLPARRGRRGRAGDRGHCRAERVLVAGGVAAGVRTYRRRSTRTRARASWSPAARSSRPRCCCARGSAARPSAATCTCIPTTAFMGFYADEQRAWWGAPMSALVDEFAERRGRPRLPDRERAVGAVDHRRGHRPLVAAPSTRQTMARLGNAAWLIGAAARPRPRHGRHRRGRQRGRALLARPTRSTCASPRTSIAAQIRIHAAAGADEIVPFAAVGAPLAPR